MPFTNGIFLYIMPFMATKIPMDNAGRVVLPKRLRDKLRLEAGDDLLVEADGDQITLRPVRPQAVLKKEYGIWVYQGEASKIPLVEWLDEEREKRVREILG
jgi:AbrB family looped-hinge helix DNA binding protein